MAEKNRNRSMEIDGFSKELEVALKNEFFQKVEAMDEAKPIHSYSCREKLMLFHDTDHQVLKPPTPKEQRQYRTVRKGKLLDTHAQAVYDTFKGDLLSF
eukprot:CAMPEP_0175878804 /NCGR_PEP_ID=MMETSP0107_2-20121207/41402_1 /TAXON_ID=195067 ORGANISM="Goniomonas pacifica, Strain CCMP1869" /NCGR_SAMPLE_ID=MMETSP0107_2 /ASSEMBLY_ACC=CAM_ASM_000203 /LENGTH=98 /DNA_ID=CAMNT_0017198351 /DNA_START=31 /DNA_END=324 /DNA_ORIENTATION=+